MLNKVILVGRLVKDPELRYTSNNRGVCQFTIAVNRPFTSESGEKKADFINCVTWDKQAENLAKYQKKGNQIALEGRIFTRSYDNKEGKKVYVTEILASNISYLDSKKDNEADTSNQAQSIQQKQEEPEIDVYEKFGNEIATNNSDDNLDLPF